MMLNEKGEPVFPLGMYERPRDGVELSEWGGAGINLLNCHEPGHLDLARKGGMMGWVPVKMIVQNDGESDALVETVNTMKDHPALAIWEGPDEAVWNVFRLDDRVVTTRPWSKPPAVRRMLESRMDDLVRGLERGTGIIRRLDPGRRIWLNEACKTNQDALSRCLPFIDVLSFDYYPIPQGHPIYDWDGYAINHVGRYTEKFARAATSKELWVVQQAFSWPSIMPQTGRPRRYPSRDEYRFMAWDAITHGATGLLWFGSAYEDRPAPFLHDLMAVVSELDGLRAFLLSGDVPGVNVRVDPDQHPPVAGVAGFARHVESRMLLALVNDDPYDHEVVVGGMPDHDLGAAEPALAGDHAGFQEIPGGWITSLPGWSTGIYLLD